MITIGIDPGAKYVGVVVRDNNDVLLASTYVRPKDMNPLMWASYVSHRVIDEIISQYPDVPVGVEGVTVPNAYNQGKLSLNSPKWVIWLAMVAGSFVALIPNAVVIRPGKNGSLGPYPKELNGRRPKDLLGDSNGAGTRNHEKSAYDVAGEVDYHLKKVILDQPLKTSKKSEKTPSDKTKKADII